MFPALGLVEAELKKLLKIFSKLNRFHLPIILELLYSDN
jgi:hypothetical protein